MHWRRIFPLRTPPWWQAQGLAVLLVAAAADLRWLLQPLFSQDFPFITFYPVALLATVWGGMRAGLTTLVLGALATLWLLVPPGFRPPAGLGYGIDVAFHLALGLGVVLLANHLRVSSRREVEFRERLEVVSEELRHRIKNLLTIVEALSRQTARNSSSIEGYEAAFRPRLMALMAAQDLLIQAADGVGVRRLVQETLKPFDIDRRLAAPAGGPDVTISPQRTIALALVLNELATNATKYGALSVPQGRISLTWIIASSGEMRMNWREMDGPQVRPPARSGFGSRLFCRGLGDDGQVRVEYRPEGVDCWIVLKP